MEENTNRPESPTDPDVGKTDRSDALTAPTRGEAEGDETNTVDGGGKTDREKSRTSSADTWTVRGVEIETRRAAKLAAKREGKFLGDWLNETIRTAAHTTLKGNSLPARQEDVTDVLQRVLDERLKPITEQLAAISQQREQASVQRPSLMARWFQRRPPASAP